LIYIILSLMDYSALHFSGKLCDMQFAERDDAWQKMIKVKLYFIMWHM